MNEQSSGLAQTKNGLIFVGWYSDLSQGMEGFQALRDAINKTADTDRELASKYMQACANNGGTVARTLTVLYDTLKPEGATPQDKEICPYTTVTDGLYIWPSDYPYYVLQYGAEVPAEFMERIRKIGPEPVITPEKADEAIDRLLGEHIDPS